jgi:tetratricopeptide (TPR) repeat protein
MPAPARRLVPALALAAALLAACRAEQPPPRPPTPVEEAAARWRADPGLPSGAADELAARGQALLREDLPASAAAARAAFKAALLREPGRLDAVAGLATAFADMAGEEPDGEGLKEAHALLAWGLAQAPTRADLLAARARLLLLVPSATNDAEALTLASRAAAAGPSDAAAALALGLARLRTAPMAAAELMERVAEASPDDRRLLTAAARARHAAGDPEAALRLAEARLALDAGHEGMLSLAVALEAEGGLADRAARRLEAWRARAPGAVLPAYLLARLLVQLEGNLRRAAALLDEAAPRAAGDFEVARLQALRAAVALAQGDEARARLAVEAALARVPASAPAQYQAARLAFLKGDRAGLRTAAGVVGGRCGRAASALLAARQAELGSDTLEEAVKAWQAWAATSPRDPAMALAAAGAVARVGFTGPALKLAAGALGADPLEGRLRPDLSDCWEGPGALVETVRRLDAVGTSEPGAAPVALSAAAAGALLLGQTAQADRLARRALAHAPQLGAARLILAQVALDRGRPTEALRLAEVAADLPGGEAAGAVRARALAAAGRIEEAERVAAAAAAAEQGGVAARLGLARVLARLGRRDEAAALARAILVEDPRVAGARGLLLDAGAAPPPARK